MKLKKSKYLLMAMLMASSIGLTACGNNQESDKPKSNVESKVTEVMSMKGEELNKIENDKKEKENYLVIDVRSPEEYKEGHLKFAINMPLDNFKNDYTSLESFKNKDVVLYCNSGKKSGEAADILVKNGFTKVYNADGVKKYNYDLVKYNNLLGSQFESAVKDSKDSTIIDARKDGDFKKASFRGALNITPDNFKENMSKLPKDKNTPIFVYCYTGNKSAKVSNMLIKDGYTNVTNALDGTKEFNYNLK